MKANVRLAMNASRKKRLQTSGWVVGATRDFLNLSEQESAYIEIKLRLATLLSKRPSRVSFLVVPPEMVDALCGYTQELKAALESKQDFLVWMILQKMSNLAYAILSIPDATSGPYSSPRHSLIRLLRPVLELEAEPLAERNDGDVVEELECPVVLNGRTVSLVDIRGSERQ